MPVVELGRHNALRTRRRKALRVRFSPSTHVEGWPNGKASVLKTDNWIKRRSRFDSYAFRKLELSSNGRTNRSQRLDWSSILHYSACNKEVSICDPEDKHRKQLWVGIHLHIGKLAEWFKAASC